MLYNIEESEIYKFAKYMEIKTNKLIQEHFDKRERNNIGNKSYSAFSAQTPKEKFEKFRENCKKQRVAYSPTE